MPYEITTSIFEMKTNLSKFIRALLRGDTDFVIGHRYGRPVAMRVALNGSDKPALEPQTKGDIAMRRRAEFRDTKGLCRRLMK